ncbi:MAG: YdiU family protein [Pseudomonadota bacterium]
MRALPNSYASLPETLFKREGPTPVQAPAPFQLNQPLADALDLDLSPDWHLALSGNDLPSGLTPVTQAYAGHQFGHWNPSLGDGRAALLGDAVLNGVPHDVQMKGSGRTHWSRGGDGRAWLGPVLREYIISEAMHAMGVPTTRALAIVTTGEPVLRESGPLPGAVLTRVAASHIRVGTFQYFAARQDIASLQALADFTLARHLPHASGPADLLQFAVQAQADLVAQWMGLGFIHGVMNTDNAHVAGITIDYGPCAFMDAFDPMKVFSSIDHGGRYAFGNQPQIAAWNMAQFATALLPLAHDRDQAIEHYTQIVHSFGTQFEAAYQAVFAAKLGLDPNADETGSLIDDLMALMAAHSLDFTQTFWALSQDEHPAGWPQNGADWWDRWTRHMNATLRKPSPAVIPRNHQIEAVIADAVLGDRTRFDALTAALATPFDWPQDSQFTQAPTPDEIVTRTFCGT